MSGKGVGDPDGSWAHFIHSAYPRRAENALPPEARARLERERAQFFVPTNTAKETSCPSN